MSDELSKARKALAEAERERHERDRAAFLARKTERAYTVAHIERAALRCLADDRDDAFAELRRLAGDIESGAHEGASTKEPQ